MNYLIPLFDCVLFNNEMIFMNANAKYEICDFNGKLEIVYDCNNQTSYVLNLKNTNKQVLKVNCGNDNYYFLLKKHTNEFFTTKIVFKSKEIVVSLFEKLFISIDGVLICEEIVDNLIYSHFEIERDMCLIFFKGERNYLVLIKDDELKFSNYYDECNISEKEKLFMCKLGDILNHGLVLSVKENDAETYLVYLDDEEMNLKQEFLPFVFLDCVKAGNYKYCNNLLCDEMKVENENEIKDFFSEFDFYYPLSKNSFALINKNTLAGIYAFEIENNKIVNITCQ